MTLIERLSEMTLIKSIYMTLFIVGLIVTIVTIPVAVFGIGLFLLGLSYCLYLHSQISDLKSEIEKLKP